MVRSATITEEVAGLGWRTGALRAAWVRGHAPVGRHASADAPTSRRHSSGQGACRRAGIAGVGVRVALRAGPATTGAALGSAWACVSVPWWAAAAPWGAVSLPSRAVQRMLRYQWARWAGRARWCRHCLLWRVGGCGDVHRILGSGRVPRRFRLHCRSRGSMGLPCTGLVGRSPAWCRGRLRCQGGVGVARAVSCCSRGRSRVGFGVGGWPGPDWKRVHHRAFAW